MNSRVPPWPGPPACCGATMAPASPPARGPRRCWTRSPRFQRTRARAAMVDGSFRWKRKQKDFRPNTYPLLSCSLEVRSSPAFPLPWVPFRAISDRGSPDRGCLCHYGDHLCQRKGSKKSSAVALFRWSEADNTSMPIHIYIYITDKYGYVCILLSRIHIRIHIPKKRTHIFHANDNKGSIGPHIPTTSTPLVVNQAGRQRVQGACCSGSSS